MSLLDGPQLDPSVRDFQIRRCIVLNLVRFSPHLRLYAMPSDRINDANADVEAVKLNR